MNKDPHEDNGAGYTSLALVGLFALLSHVRTASVGECALQYAIL